MQAETEKKKRQYGQVGLCGPRKRLESANVDEYACVGYVSEIKMSVWTSRPFQCVAKERKRLRE